MNSGGGAVAAGGDGSGRVLIPNNVRKTIQNIKEITGNHSEEDIYAMLKECSMDPNETADKLLLQGYNRLLFPVFLLYMISISLLICCGVFFFFYSGFYCNFCGKIIIKYGLMAGGNCWDEVFGQNNFELV